MNCSFIGCEQEAIADIPDLPYAMCDEHFAWQGMARVKKVSALKDTFSRIQLFLSIVWRPCLSGIGRISVKTAWEVARTICDSGAIH